MFLRQHCDNVRTDKDTTHSYLEVYEELFVANREQVQNLLEIGVLDGGSMTMWHSVFPNAQIYGLDCKRYPNALPWYTSPRAHEHIGDAYDPAFASAVCEGKQFDIMIDDGPHTLESMIAFVKLYFPYLASNGIMVIEDVQDIQWCETIRNAFPEHVRGKVEILDRRSLKGRYDDIMIVLKNN